MLPNYYYFRQQKSTLQQRVPSCIFLQENNYAKCENTMTSYLYRILRTACTDKSNSSASCSCVSPSIKRRFKIARLRSAWVCRTITLSMVASNCSLVMFSGNFKMICSYFSFSPRLFRGTYYIVLCLSYHHISLHAF